jgi:DNA-binding winged helix-turn-helix (wHTH) protein/tetratricopeptide (TPR) repeat protein
MIRRFPSSHRSSTAASGGWSFHEGALQSNDRRFGVFEADLRAEELRRAGVHVRLQAQPFRVLSLLLERPGEIVSRDEIVRELWGSDTFVDFDQSIGAVIRKLRRALGDSAESPRYIETLRHKGYRFLPPIQTEEVPPGPLSGSAAQPTAAHRRLRWSYLSIGLIAGAALSLIVMARSERPSESTAPDRGATAQRPPNRRRDAGAYIAYQKGRYLWEARTAAAVENSIVYFQQALNLDPDYAAAHAGLADAYALLNFYTGRQRGTSVALARAANERALRLDPTLAEAHATQAYIKLHYEWDWPGAEDAFRKAVAIDPDYATAHQWYAEYLFYMRRFPEALREITRAHELDPQSVVISFPLASPHLFSGQYTQAIDKIQEALRLSPEFPLGIYMLATCYERIGRFDEAVAEYRKIARTKLGLAGMGYAYGRSGRRQEARQILHQLLRESRREGLSAYHVARVYAALGETRQAFRWLGKARDARDERMVMIQVDPKLDHLRSDPLFRDLLQNLSLA